MEAAGARDGWAEAADIRADGTDTLPGTLPACDAPQRLQNWASSALGEPQLVQNM